MRTAADTTQQARTEYENISKSMQEKNLLFKPAEFSLPASRLFLQNLRRISTFEPNPVILMSTDNNEVTEQDAMNDVAFLLCLGHMIGEFDKSLESLRTLILCMLEDYSELAYLTLIQIPHCKRDYLRLLREINVQLEAPDHGDCSMRLVTTHMIKYLKSAYDSGLFICPHYTSFAIKQGLQVPSKDGTSILHVDAAAALLNDPTLFLPTITPDEIPKFALRTLVSQKLLGAPLTNRRTPTTTTQVEDLSPLVSRLLQLSTMTTASGQFDPSRCQKKHVSESRRLSSAISALFKNKRKNK